MDQSLQEVTSPPATQFEIHERQQLEVRFNYALGSETGPQRYTIDAFLFVPRNVGVNRGNYDRAEFYSDVTPLVRLDAAPMPLTRLADPSHPDSPLSRLERARQEFCASAHPPPSKPLAVPVKLYAYLFTIGARAELTRLGRLAAEAAPELEVELSAALGRMRDALWAYRRVRASFWAFEAVCHPDFAEELRASDEYMSLFVDERLTRFVDAVAAEPALRDGTGRAVRCRLLAAGLAREEARYRQKYGYLTLEAAGGGAGEYFAYRSGLLKKAVQSALYLDMREVKVDTFVRNAVGAVAAALAAIWATALAMTLPGSFADLPSRTKWALFAAAVGAYVLKDRIKAVTNEFLVPRLRQFDHTRWLGGEALAAVGLGMLNARLRERMRFVHETDVPQDILAARRSRRTVRNALALTEEVIHYRKVLETSSEEEAPLPRGYWVRDILRLNVRHFLTRLDEPLDPVEYFDLGQDAFAHAKLPKVYHLNMVLKTTRETATTVQERTETIKVLLNKEGLVRVEAHDRGVPVTDRRRTALRLPSSLRARPGRKAD